MQLFEAQGDSLFLLLHVQNDAFNLFAFLDHLGWMVDLLGPTHIGNVKQAVDALFNLHEGPIIGQIANPALDPRVGRIFFGYVGPRIWLGLLDSQRDLVLVLVDFEDDDLDHVADGQHLGGVVDPAGPTHFADVHQPFNAGFELHKRAVVHDVDHLALQAAFDRIAILDLLPGVRLELLVAQGNLLFGKIDVEDFDLDFVVDVKHFGRMSDSIPTQVGDMQ